MHALGQKTHKDIYNNIMHVRVVFTSLPGKLTTEIKTGRKYKVLFSEERKVEGFFFRVSFIFGNTLIVEEIRK